MPSRFIDVHVEEHEQLPDGCSMRFRAQGEGHPVARVRWESDDGVSGTWRVEGVTAGGERTSAQAFEVDDSSAGTSILVVGAEHGLRLRSVETGHVVAAPYLLLSRAALVDEGP